MQPLAGAAMGARGMPPPHAAYVPENNANEPDAAKDFGGTLSQTEKGVLAQFMLKMGFQKMLLLANFQSRFKAALRAPTGYVATLHRDLGFVSDAFKADLEMFKGLAYVRVEKPPARSDAEMQVLFRRLNLFVSDVSPDPPRVGRPNAILASPAGGWVPSLGTNGFLGLYQGHVFGEQARAAPKEKLYYLIVNAGLDRVTCGDLDAVLDKLSRTTMPGGAPVEPYSVGDVFAPGGEVQVFRDLAVENRNRLLALGIEYLKLVPIGAVVDQRVDPFSFLAPATVEGPKAEACLQWLGVGDVRIPAWFHMPRDLPRGFVDPPPAELRGFELGRHLPLNALKRPLVVRNTTGDLSYQDIPYNDVLEYQPPYMAVYMGCCATTSHGGAPRLMGPGRDFCIYNFGYQADWTHPPKFNAWPCEAVQLFAPEHVQPPPVNLTWQRADLRVNRPASATYVFYDVEGEAPQDRRGGVERGAAATGRAPLPLDERYGRVCAESAYLGFDFMLGRVSAHDAWGQARPPKEANRFTRMRVDDDYGPL